MTGHWNSEITRTSEKDNEKDMIQLAANVVNGSNILNA